MAEIIKFPESAIKDVRHLSTKVLVRLFWEWNGIDCDRYGCDCVKGYSIRAIQEEVNRRGEGKKVAV